MKLLGKNLATVKSKQGNILTLDHLIALLIQMLDSIENVHSRGFIHRDIKPSNFVIGKDEQRSNVFIIDFGLAKKHLQNNNPIQKRAHADFRGTITYASLNAHMKKELSRRDDLWSFYFVILDFLTDNLPWRNIPNKDDVAEQKNMCLLNPSQHLWNHKSIKDIK